MSDLSPVNDGTQLEGLTAVRAAIVADLEACESMRDKAALYLRLQNVMERIEDIKPVEKKGDAVDEIAKRRAARRASAATG